MPSVREATFDVLRRYGLTSLFANPGSTEIHLLADLPDDLRFVLGLHESSVVGMATGWAIGRGEPALAILHTTAGLGNAVGALATARVNRAPLVVVVGQQDRRHLATEPFLAGKLRGLAGEYPVWVDEPLRAQDVPGAVARAYHEAVTARGPALVIVPMDDWANEAGETDERAAARRVVRPRTVDGDAVVDLAALIEGAESPAIVAGSGADDPDTWGALVALAERLRCPVWQESFGSRAGFPQDHPIFAGHLPADRARLRETLAPHDVVLVVGGPAFRQYPFHPGPFVEPGTRVAMVSQDPAEVHRSAADLAVLAHPAPVCAELARLVPARSGAAPVPFARPPAPAPPGRRRAAPRRARPRGDRRAPPARRDRDRGVAVEPAGAARAPAGARAARFPEPGDGRARVRAPGRDRAAHGAARAPGASRSSATARRSTRSRRSGAPRTIAPARSSSSSRTAATRSWTGSWSSTAAPRHGRAFGVDVAGLARAFGCPARTVHEHGELLQTLDEVLPGLAGREEPLLLEVAVAPDETFAP